jgi:hypothetical protein
VEIAQSLDDGKIVEALEFRPWRSGAFLEHCSSKIFETRSIQIKYLELMKIILESSNK